MSIGKANCLVCGEPIVYFEQAQPVKCVICGKEETGHCTCEKGHYVCDACHRTQGVDYIMGLCSKSKSKNPIEIAQEAMNDKSIYPNGPEHHTLIGAALLTAYWNAGGKFAKCKDLNAALAELKKRSLNVPGGTCGFWGTCGAAVSTGQAVSIMNGSTPMTKGPWAQCQKMTSIILGDLADLGGPRCCKRTGFTAIKDAVPFVRENMGVPMQLPETIECTFYQRNEECLRMECPYFPGTIKKAAEAAEAEAAAEAE